MKIKKLLLGFLVLAMASCQSNPVPTNPSTNETVVEYALEDNIEFNAYIDDLFNETLLSSQVNMHQLVKDPSHFNLDITQVQEGFGSDYSKESLQQQKDILQTNFDTLIGFDYDSLSRKQQDLYDTLYFDMNLRLKASDSKFDYYDQVFSTMSGLHTQIPTILQHARIETKEDAYTVISIMNSIPSFIESALTYSQQQIELNTLITNADDVIFSCETFIHDDRKPILTVLTDKVSQLTNISAQDKSDIIQEITDKYSDIESSYQAIIDFFTENKDKINPNGYASLPNGKEYYALICQLEMGFEYDIDSLPTLLDDFNSEYMGQLYTLMMKHQDDPNYLDFLYEDYFLPFFTYEEIIDFAKSKMNKYGPSISEVSLDIYDLPASLATDGVLAYYLYPELDDYQHQTVCVNPFTADLSSLSTYTTVNHESYLGHLYQTTYAYDHNPGSSVIKVLYAPTANVEGYARYSEYLSLLYMGYWNAEQAKIYTINEVINGLLMVQLDYGIHYLNWNQQQCIDYLKEIGIEMSATEITPLYEQLRCNVAAFQPYELGRIVYLQLRQKALDELGNRYNEVAFNTALLDASHTPLNTLTRSVNEYIQSKLQ